MVTACIPCRRRKCKCDSARPSCIQCTIRKQQCSYEVVSDKRKRSHKEFEELRKLVNTQRMFLDVIAEGGPRSERMIRRLQEDESFSSQWINEEGMTGPTDDITLINNLLTSDGQGKISYYGDTSNYLMIRDTTQKSPFVVGVKRYDISPTPVPEDIYLELLNLYFCWQHTYFNILDKDLFLRDMNSGGPFSSDFLFYSILTHAAHLYERNSRADFQDPTIFGESFYKTAIDMIPQELENPSLTTVQGLLILASKESGIGKSTLGWIHSGIAFRIAIDLGLHMESSNLKGKGVIAEEEERVRATTFWGCYIFDQGWSSYLGRPAIIQERDITLPFLKFILETPVDWSPFNEGESGLGLGNVVKHYPHNTLNGIITLYRILKIIIVEIYSGIGKKEYRSLLLFHSSKLKNWFLTLPKELKWIEGTMHPAVIMMHTMYYATTIFLYRPFLKLGGKDWKYEDISDPIDICVDSAGMILTLLGQYRRLYTLRKIVNLASYVTSTAAAVYISLSSEAYSAQLLICNQIFSDLGESWPEAKLILDIINNRITGHDESGGLETMNNPNNDFSNLISDFNDFMFGNDIFIDWTIFDS